MTESGRLHGGGGDSSQRVPRCLGMRILALADRSAPHRRVTTQSFQLPHSRTSEKGVRHSKLGTCGAKVRYPLKSAVSRTTRGAKGI